MSVLSPVFCQTPAVTCRGRVEAGRRKMSVSVGSVPRPASVHLAALLLLMSRSRGSDHGWGKCGPGCGGGGFICHSLPKNGATTGMEALLFIEKYKRKNNYVLMINTVFMYYT